MRARTPGAATAASLVLLLLLAGCATVAAVAPPVPVVVTLGDSVPAGTACGCDPFPLLYARAQHAAAVNLAVPGSTAADVLAALPADRGMLAGAAEVLLMTGANDVADVGDASDAADGVRVNVTATIGAIESIRRVPVIVLGYWNIVRDGQVGAAQYGPDGVKAAAAATALVNDALIAAAKDAGATYVPTLAAFHGDDGAQDPTGLLASDGDHPNAAGHQAIADLIPPLPAE